MCIRFTQYSVVVCQDSDSESASEPPQGRDGTGCQWGSEFKFEPGTRTLLSCCINLMQQNRNPLKPQSPGSQSPAGG